MKKIGIFCLFSLCILIVTSGCTSASEKTGQSPQQTVGSQGTVATPAPTLTVPVNTTVSPSVPATSVMTTGVPATTIAPSQPMQNQVIIDEKIPLISGDKQSAKIYTFKAYGLEYLYPNDTFLISVDSEKPINIIVTDYKGQADYHGIIPSWERLPPFKVKSDARLYGWNYPGLWYVLKVDEIYKKVIPFTITDKGAYYLIIDPQTVVEQESELGVWHIKQNNFNANIKVEKVPSSRIDTIVPTSPYIIDETIAVYDGYRNGYKEYPLENYGLGLQQPGDTFKLSIDAEKPVNVLVLDIDAEKMFDTITPVYEMQIAKGDKPAEYGYTYSGLTYLLKEDKVVKKDITFTIKKAGKYFIVIDQRFADPKATSISYFKANVKLSKI